MGFWKGRIRILNYYGSWYVQVRGNNIIGHWVGKSCVNYCVVLNLVSGSSSGYLGYIAGTTTWGFPRF